MFDVQKCLLLVFHWKFSLIYFKNFWYQQSHICTKAAKRIIKNYGFSRISQFSIPKILIKSHNKISNRKTFRSPKNIYFYGIGPTRVLNKNLKYCLRSVDVSKTFRLASSNLIWNVFFCDQNCDILSESFIEFSYLFLGELMMWGFDEGFQELFSQQRQIQGVPCKLFFWIKVKLKCASPKIKFQSA